jgi:hypothetical protein
MKDHFPFSSKRYHHEHHCHYFIFSRNLQACQPYHRLWPFSSRHCRNRLWEDRRFVLRACDRSYIGDSLQHILSLLSPEHSCCAPPPLLKCAVMSSDPPL